MKQNILILGLGAFGFAVAKHLGENNPQTTIYASEINTEIYNYIEENRKHPYFFADIKNNSLPENIKLVGGEDLRSDTKDENIHPLHNILPEIDIIISIIPCQFVGGAFEKMKDLIKDDVTILNLSKGIDNISLQTVSEKLNSLLNSPQSSPREELVTGILPSHGEGLGESYRYTYAYLAGGMIASELVEGKHLGADIVTPNSTVGEILKTLFASNSLDINLKIGDPKNTELYAALKNIVALILGYYEGNGAGASTLGYYFSKLLGEMQGVIELLNNAPLSGKKRGQGGVENKEQMNFTDYALSGDLIATCFGGSRNRLLGNILGKGTSIEDALSDLKSQNKIAEGYETLKGVYKITQGIEGFEEINSFGKKYL